MRVRDGDHRTIELDALTDEELNALAYDRPVARATLVAVVSELRRRDQRRRKRGCSPDVAARPEAKVRSPVTEADRPRPR